MEFNLVVTDKVYSGLTHSFKASLIEGVDGSDIDLMLDIETARSKDCLFLDKSEIDSMIDFLVLVRSKMDE